MFVRLLVELELIQLDSLLLPLILEFPKSFKCGLRLSLTSFNLLAVLDDRLSELLPDHTLDLVLTVALPRWPVSKEVMLRLLAIEDLDLDFLQRIRELNVASLQLHEVRHGQRINNAS